MLAKHFFEGEVVATNQQEQHVVEAHDQKQSSRKSLLEVMIIIFLVGLVIVAIVAASLWLFLSQGIKQASLILPVVIGLVTVVISFLGIMIGYFQWRFPSSRHTMGSIPSSEPDSLLAADVAHTASQQPKPSSLQSSNTAT
jgi:flagellar basal body-associated protein FliL